MSVDPQLVIAGVLIGLVVGLTGVGGCCCQCIALRTRTSFGSARRVVRGVDRRRHRAHEPEAGMSARERAHMGCASDSGRVASSRESV